MNNFEAAWARVVREKREERQWCVKPIARIALILLYAWLLMSVWNDVATSVFDVGQLGYWQAVGVVVLLRLLE